MKRILSVILSLALLASVLIIPMSVSAEATEAETAAAQAVIDAVNGLKVDLNAVNPIELAVPVDSREAVTDAPPKGSEDDPKYSHPFDQPGSLDHSTIAASDNPTVGTTTVKVKDNYPVIKKGYGLEVGDLHAIKYSVNVPEKMSYVKDIDYIVVYVKTNRSFKMRLGTHNGYSYAGAITDDIQVDANDTYQPVVLSLRDGFAKNYKSLYSIDRSFTRGIYLSIASMIDGENNTIAGSDINFGSILYVPGDTAARDFKYTIVGGDTRTVDDRFTAADGVTADMILAAEEIENDGRYDADKFAALQTAIHNAKNLFIKNASDEEVITLFKSEAKELYKLEEIFRPHYVTTTDGSKDVDAPSTSSLSDISALNLTDAQKASFGEHAVKVTDNFKNVHFADKTATSKWPAATFGVKTYTDYKNVYMAVYNAGATQSSGFSSYLQFKDGVGIFNDATIKMNSSGAFDLYNGYHLYNLYATPVNNYQTDYVLSHIKKFSFTTFNRYQMTFSSLGTTTAAPTSGGTEIYIGSVIGEKPIDVSDIGSVLNKATLIDYYAEKIANKGYENTAAVEDTMELLGLTTVEVVRELNNTIGIKYPDNAEYTLNAAVVGENVSFTLDNIPDGVDVTVKYGDVEIEPDGDVYTIKVAMGKELHIIPSHVTTTFMNADTSNYTADINTNLNLAKGITPYMFVTKGGSRTKKDSSTADFSDGNVDTGYEPNPGFKFSNDDKTFINGYKPYNSNDPTTVFNFNKNASEYDAFVDVIYDLGRVADINKVQHFGHKSADLNLGAYSVYASTDVNNLFNRNESLVVDYQNKDIANSQQHEFPTRSARFVAFRIYCPVTTSDRAVHSNQLRIKELAIYGTPTNDIDYKVTEIQTPTSKTPTPVDDGDLLNDKTFKSVKAYEDGEFKGADIWDSETNLEKLNSGTYYEGVHANISCGVVYYKDGKCKNGYSFDRSNLNGNIVFNVPNTPKTYYDFTYDLGDYYAVDRVDMYTSSLTDRRVQAYEVYIGNDLDTLYTGTPVVVYNNYYNIYGQKIKFDKAKIGKYVGYRVLNPGTATDNDTYPRISELAAYGNKVTSATDENLKPNGGLSSESVFLWNKDNSSVYTGDDGETEYTAARLSVKYQSPLGENGIADTSKICLANGESANIVERNVIAIAKTKYSPETGLDITTAGAKHSTATGEALNKCWKTNGQDVYAVFKLNNIKSKQKDLGFVVVGRIVYEYNGTYYTEYSPVFGADQDISAQSVYNAAFGSESNQGWFKQ